MVGCLIAWAVCGLITAFVAGFKGYNDLERTILVILGPLGLLVSVFMPSQSRRTDTGRWQRCPYCKSVIRRGALVCRYCRRDLS